MRRAGESGRRDAERAGDENGRGAGIANDVGGRALREERAAVVEAAAAAGVVLTAGGPRTGRSRFRVVAVAAAGSGPRGRVRSGRGRGWARAGSRRVVPRAGTGAVLAVQGGRREQAERQESHLEKRREAGRAMHIGCGARCHEFLCPAWTPDLPQRDYARRIRRSRGTGASGARDARVRIGARSVPKAAPRIGPAYTV